MVFSIFVSEILQIKPHFKVKNCLLIAHCNRNIGKCWNRGCIQWQKLLARSYPILHLHIKSIPLNKSQLYLPEEFWRFSFILFKRMVHFSSRMDTQTSSCLKPTAGIVMVGVIIGSKRMGINPDNVATPLAASGGDLITLALLACFSQWFYSFIGERN